MERREDFDHLYARLSNTRRVSLRQRSVGVLMLVALAGFILSGGSIMAFYFLPNQDLLIGERRSAGDMSKLIHAEYGGDEYIIPEPFVRNVSRSLGGKVQRIEIRLPWPFRYDDRRPIFADSLNSLGDSLFINFEKRQDALTPEQRFAWIYIRFLAGPPKKVESDLKFYTFRSNAPYPQSELYLGNVDRRLVIIRCEPATEQSGPVLCESEIPLNPTVLARYRFHRAHLKYWRDLDRTAREMISIFRQPGAA